MLYDATRRWIRQGSCRTVDPERWFPGGPGSPDRSPPPAVQKAWDEVKKICSFCPVLEECRRDTLGEEFGVWGGRDERERYLLRRKLYRQAQQWSPELRLAWGEELHRLRKAGLSWTRIRNMTGIGEGQLADELITEWAAHLRAQAEQGTAQVIDLPLPEPEKKPFPEKPSGRDMWVRHNNLVGSAHYMGETPDGAWIKVQLKAGRGNSIKWVRREDVQFHDPKPKNIVEYLGRPDGANARAC